MNWTPIAGSVQHQRLVSLVRLFIAQSRRAVTLDEIIQKQSCYTQISQDDTDNNLQWIEFKRNIYFF